MDLLGSIMNSMDKPPAPTEKEKLLIKSKLNKYIFRHYESFVVVQKENKRWKSARTRRKRN